MFEIIGFSLTVFGLFLTVILSDPFIKKMKQTIENMNRAKWSGDEYQKGRVLNLYHFGFERWNVVIRIDAAGNAEHKLSARIINLQNGPLDKFYFPFYTDVPLSHEDDLDAWAYTGNRRLNVHTYFSDTKRTSGRVIIYHDPPLTPGESRSFRWGITLPKVFSEGDDFFNWAVEVPYFSMEGELIFENPWRIRYAKWKNKDNDSYKNSPIVDDNTIKWAVKLPKLGQELQMLFGLVKHKNR